MSNKYIYVESNIGGGKTTLLNIIHKIYPSITIIEEPVKKWQSIGILNAYYTNPQRYGYTFQTCALSTKLCRVYNISLGGTNNTYIIERSGLADRYVFMNVMSQIHELNEVELASYDCFYNDLIKMSGIFSDDKKIGFIYISTSPSTCRERVIKRDRIEEKDNAIPIDYLNKLHIGHKDVLLPMIATRFGKDKILNIDGEGDYINDLEYQRKVLSDIIEFIKYI